MCLSIASSGPVMVCLVAYAIHVPATRTRRADVTEKKRRSFEKARNEAIFSIREPPFVAGISSCRKIFENKRRPAIKLFKWVLDNEKYTQ